MTTITKELDLLSRLNQTINGLDLYARSSIGLLGTGDSLSVMAMPGGDETVYFDGSRDKDYQVQVSAKSKDQQACYNALTAIYQTFENLVDLPSRNGSYDFQSIETKSLPSLVQQDEEGFYVFALSISAKITIYKGVTV